MENKRMSSESPVILNIRPGIGVMNGANGEDLAIDVVIFIDDAPVLKTELRFQKGKGGPAGFTEVPVAAGRRRLRIESLSGRAKLAKTIDLRKSRWLSVSYMFTGKDASGGNEGEFEMTLQDKPFYYR